MGYLATGGVYLFALLAILFGLMGMLIYLLAIVDPAGAKLADDADPFGPPPPMRDSLFGLVVSAGVFWGGVLLPVGYYFFDRKYWAGI